MPAHISHLLFAENARREAGAGAEAIPDEARHRCRLGAQGSDPFNRLPELFEPPRRKPDRTALQRTAGPELP